LWKNCHFRGFRQFFCGGLRFRICSPLNMGRVGVASSWAELVMGRVDPKSFIACMHCTVMYIHVCTVPMFMCSEAQRSRMHCKRTRGRPAYKKWCTFEIYKSHLNKKHTSYLWIKCRPFTHFGSWWSWVFSTGQVRAKTLESGNCWQNLLSNGCFVEKQEYKAGTERTH
jgi:hypothetical protein